MQYEMNGTIYWPNGMGYTECTEEYATLHDKLAEATAEYREDQSPESYETMCRLESDLFQLQAAGHVGQSVRFDKPDVMAGLLGGGSVDRHGNLTVK